MDDDELCGLKCPLLVVVGGATPWFSIILDINIATLGLISGGSRLESVIAPFIPFIWSRDI